MQHPFVTGEYQELHIAPGNSVMVSIVTYRFDLFFYLIHQIIFSLYIQESGHPTVTTGMNVKNS